MDMDIYIAAVQPRWVAIVFRRSEKHRAGAALPMRWIFRNAWLI